LSHILTLWRTIIADNFLEPFRMAIEVSNARGIMASENAINGQACSTTTLLKDVVRGEWNFSGFISHGR
jgi:beta-glucosidase-like glycosyl hydrolase